MTVTPVSAPGLNIIFSFFSGLGPLIDRLAEERNKIAALEQLPDLLKERFAR